MGILTVGVVTKPFQFEGMRRMRVADAGINELQAAVDTLIVIPNQNLFRVANEKTTFADAFAMADQVLYSGVACITDLMVKEGLINLDFADVRAVMRGMGKAMMGTGEASGEKRANRAAEAAIANPLLDEVSMKGARGLLISITGGHDLTLYEVDEAATRIREEVDQEANIILGATFDESLEGIVRVSVVATGIDQALITPRPDLSATEQRISEVAERLRSEARARASHRRARLPAERAPAELIDLEAAGAPAPVAANEAVRGRAGPSRRRWPARRWRRPRRPEAVPGLRARAGSAEADAGLRAIPSPPAERAVVRPARMPRDRGAAGAGAGPDPGPRAELDAQDHKRRTLLQRLATVGFGRKDEGLRPRRWRRSRRAADAAAAARPGRGLASADVADPRGVRQAAAAPRSPRSRSTGPPPAPSEPPGRVAPLPHRSMDDDQLEIPAFLRRQAN